jgi:hypothetical protein
MRLITLHLLNDLGADSIGGSIADTPHAWPGTPVEYDITDPPEVGQVWVGVSQDGSDNQVYPKNTSVATIIAAGWPRVYQVAQIFGFDGSVQVFSETQKTVQVLIDACCLHAPTSESPSSVSPGESASPSPGDFMIFGEAFGSEFE